MTPIAQTYAAHFDTIVERACNYVGREENVELQLLKHNDSTVPTETDTL